MKNKVLICINLMLLYIPINLSAQSFESIAVPTMPSAVIIGSQVNEISKPKSLKALETTVLNNFLDSNNNVLIPNNYAIEVTPYMLSKRKNFNYREYLKDSVHTNIVRNFSVSIASTNQFKVNDSIFSNALGLGVRTVILNGKVDKDQADRYEQIIEEYRAVQDLNSSLMLNIKVSTINSPDTINTEEVKLEILDLKEFSSDEHQKIITKIFNQLPKDTTKMVFYNLVNDLVKKVASNGSTTAFEKFRTMLDTVKNIRYGFYWDVDAAMALSFPTNDFNYSVASKYGFWSNFTYKPQNGNLNYTALIRWMNHNDDFINSYIPEENMRLEAGDIWDFGLRASWKVNKLTAELEYIYRFNRNKEIATINNLDFDRKVDDNTNKFILNLNYTINKDLVLSYNIGKNYDGIHGSEGNLITGFTVNFGFGGIKLEDLENGLKQDLDKQN